MDDRGYAEAEKALEDIKNEFIRVLRVREFVEWVAKVLNKL